MTKPASLDDPVAWQTLLAPRPMRVPQAALVWTAVVDVDEREALGPSGLGERFIVPITGGYFRGGPGHEELRGRVRPGGADRQLLRPDGVKQLRAEYELQTDDGAVLTVDNRVVIDDTRQPRRYALSHVHVTAPAGAHAWLNRRLLVGTLDVLRPERQAVLIRVFVLDA
jgi:hypothetical protein